MNQQQAQLLLQLESAEDWRRRLRMDGPVPAKDIAHLFGDYSAAAIDTLDQLMRPMFDEGFVECVGKDYQLTQKWYDSLDRRVTILENRLENMSVSC